MGPDVESTFEALIRCSGDYILRLDASYRIRAASRSFVACFTPEGEPLGRDFLELLDPGSRDKARRILGDPHRESGTVELNQRTDAGAIRLVNYSFCRRPAPGGAGEILAIGRDQEVPLQLVERMARLTVELEEARRAAEAANRAKDRFLAMLGHELRTPLTPVLLAASALLDDRAAPELRGDLEMIRRNVELEARLIDDLLDVSRIERGTLRLELETVDVHGAIRQAVEVCRPEIDAADLEVTLDLSARTHHARADRTRLMQVVWNLVRNAARYTPSGGRLAIRSQSRGKPGAGPLVVEFQDTGIGIEPEALLRIFEPFERGSAPLGGGYGGLGLGLAISRAVAEAHGGRLTAHSPGRDLGSTFLLELPTVPAPAATPRVASPPPVAVPGSPPGLRILLVEDNKDTLRYLALVLRKRGHEVRTAENLDAAHAAVASAPFDLLLSDIELPDGTGLDLMRALGGGRGVPGIAMSGFGSEDDV
ncbi:MAG TPA: hybrid sensor histidine kinase/response regulator, partial [Isosphaeraceae bacterium]